MKHSVLKAIGHNIAHSLASGVGFMIGVFQTDVFAEASAKAPGYLDVDFLNARVIGTSGSPSLRRAVQLYGHEALPTLCRAHSVELSDIATLRVRYSVHRVHGPEFTVTVEDIRGRQSVDSYSGWPGTRLYKKGSQIMGSPRCPSSDA